MLIEEEFIKKDVRIEYVLGQYPDNDEGRLQKHIRAGIAEYEKAKIIERMGRGKKGKAKSGYIIVGARPPYGYWKKSEPHKAWLEIDEDGSCVARLIFEWFIYGDEENGPLSMNAIARKLTSLGIPTRGDKRKHVAKKRGKGVWQPATVHKILGNETYTGVWHFGKTKMVNDGKSYNRPRNDKRGPGKQVPNERKNWIPVEVLSMTISSDRRAT
jgi:site-specific DNA recombinase